MLHIIDLVVTAHPHVLATIKNPTAMFRFILRLLHYATDLAQFGSCSRSITERSLRHSGTATMCSPRNPLTSSPTVCHLTFTLPSATTTVVSVFPTAQARISSIFAPSAWTGAQYPARSSSKVRCATLCHTCCLPYGSSSMSCGSLQDLDQPTHSWSRLSTTTSWRHFHMARAKARSRGPFTRPLGRLGRRLQGISRALSRHALSQRPVSPSSSRHILKLMDPHLWPTPLSPASL